MVNDKNLEEEANYFAMCLLMPEHLVKREVEKIKLDLTSDGPLKQLAKTFDVSITAMALRLAQLRINLL